MRLLLALLALIGGANQAARAAAPAWMPMPVKVEPAAGRFVIDANFTVETGPAPAPTPGWLPPPGDSWRAWRARPA